MYSVISFVCIVFLAVFALFVLSVLVFKRGADRIEFIRKFKRGAGFLVYVPAIPLYTMANLHNGESFWDALFVSVSRTIKLVVLEYELEDLQALMDVNAIFQVAVYVCFVLAAVNAILLVMSLFGQRLVAMVKRFFWWVRPRGKLLLVGYNEENVLMYLSDKEHDPMLVGVMSEEDVEYLSAKGIRFVAKTAAQEHSITEYCCKQLKKCLKSSWRRRTILINTGDDAKNIEICYDLLRCTRELFGEWSREQMADGLSRVKIYVFGSTELEAIYHDLVEASDGCIHYLNQHCLSAMDFVDRYPLTQFMTAKQIDYEKAMLRPEIDVNVVMIGFGRANQQILLTSVANNQLMTEQNGEPVLKQVHYHVFDREHLSNNKNLNHGYYRFKNEFADERREQEETPDSSPYLPFPSLPAVEHYYPLDINDAAFYESIKRVVCGAGKFNYIVISFGSDLENIDMAQKILEKKREWGLEDTYVFVKVKSGDDSFTLFARDDCYLVGNHDSIVYNIGKIENDRATAMAQMRNRIYSLEYELTENGAEPKAEMIRATYAAADCGWHMRKTQIERDSNLYACLSLRSKLHMIGLDYCLQSDEGEGMDEQTYLRHYAGDDMPDYYEGIRAEDKPIVRYGLDFADSRRRTMAIHEHYRWNSFMVSRGFVPASKKQILDDRKKNGKDYSLRRHGNLTTFEGLEEFRRMVAARNAEGAENADLRVLEEKADVIKYDYQLMDDAHWLLSKNGYKIVKRKQ